MMNCGYIITDEWDDQFVDFRDDLSSAFNSCFASPATSASFRENNSIKSATYNSLQQVWIQSPGSIQERRAFFMKQMGLVSIDQDGDVEADDTTVDRSSTEDDTFSRKSSFKWPDEVPNSLKKISSEKHQSDFVSRPSNHDNILLRSDSTKSQRTKNLGWLWRLGSIACSSDRKSREINSRFNDADESCRARIQRVQVHLHKTKINEFSAVYLVQSFKAHSGAILTMKFSPEGEYLASGGKDGVVRVWQVMECMRKCEDNIQDDDPLGIYFILNPQSKPSLPYADKLKKVKSMSLPRISDSACVVYPRKTFLISEKPLSEFHGHKGDVLDLAWSKDKCLLSSSIDKSVRLWQMVPHVCLKVFTHNDYVTCIQFNPIDERFFASGSIDGKVRIWKLQTCRVANWIDVKQIVTAICFRPDGKGVVVGSMMGDCLFYIATDDNMQLVSNLSFGGKKKSLDKKITGLQFCPGSSDKLMVASANSAIRILDGINVIFKYKGHHNNASQMTASFTSDGRHIVSASEDSNVNIWSHSNESDSPWPASKSIRSSVYFAASHISSAVPWQGFSKNSSLEASENDFLCRVEYIGNKFLYLSVSSKITVINEFFADFIDWRLARWPEERLLFCMEKNLNMRNSCQKASHSWGQVIVTAGKDGRIRSFQNYGLPVYL